MGTSYNSDIKKDIIISYFEKLGYSKSHMELHETEFPVTFGGKTIKISTDIIIKIAVENKLLPAIAVDIKEPTQRIRDLEKQNAISYARLHNPPIKIAVITNGNEWKVYNTVSKKRLTEGVPDLKNFFSIKGELSRKQIEESQKFVVEGYKNTKEIIGALEKCHNIMRSNDGFTPLDAFDEMNKIIYTKRQSERSAAETYTENKFTEKYFIQECETNRKIDFEKIKKTANRIFEDAIEDYQFKEEIFDKKTKIRICGESIFAIIKLLDNQGFLETEHEIIGLAFENFLTTVFRGERLGQYFTPRSLVDFAIDMIGVKPGEKIIDPAFGSGGFLVEAFKVLREHIIDGEIIEERKQKEIEKLCQESIFGSDINKRLTIACKTNMYIHGAGKASLYHNDGLFDTDEIKEGKFHKVFTNPPFGSKIEKQRVLEQFELAGKNRKMQRSEVLFLERCIKLLKPGGQMAIVLPDIILNGANNVKTREFIINNCKILAIVSLPRQTFIRSGANVKTSMLFLEKPVSSKKYTDKIFMAIPEKIGFDSAGRPDISDLGKTAETFHKFINDKEFEENKTLFTVSQSVVKGRLDPKTYFEAEKVESEFNTIKLEDLIEQKKEKIIPCKYPEAIFKILGINNKNGVFISREDKGAGIKLPHIKIQKNDFCYNPSRIDIGAIGLSPFDDSDQIITGYYKVFYADEKKILPPFLANLFKTKNFLGFIKEKARGSVRMDLTVEDLKKWRIPLPSLEFQKTFIDKIEVQKKLIENASGLITGLSDIEIPESKGKRILKEFITESLYGISSKCEKTGKYPVLRMINLDTAGTWNLEDLKYTDTELPAHRFLQKGDFIFNRTNSVELVGKSGVIDFDFTGTWASYMIRFRFNEHLNPYYLKYLFAQKKYRNYISSIAKQSGGQANISAQQFGEIEIDYRSIEIQKKIAEKFRARFEQIKVLKEIIKSASNTKQEIIESIFKLGVTH